MVRKKEEKNKGKNKKDKEKKKKLSKKEIRNRQVMWAVILMGSIILIIVLVPFIVKNFVNKFVYINLDWQKTKLGELTFYSTRVPLVDKSWKITGFYSMNFRNNPKKLDSYVKTELSGGEVGFNTGEVVYISLNPDMEACEDNIIALIPFAGFLKDFANLNIKSAVNDEDYAALNDMIYATCENSRDNTVIYINSGEKTEIRKSSPTCYEITYSNCEITQVTEKFVLIILENYMSYFVR